MSTRKTSKLIFALGAAAPLALGLVACDDGPLPGGGGSCNAQTPFVDDWEVVFDGPLAAELGGDNAALNVSAISIGGTVVEDNFMNRGDIEVYYTNPPIDGNGIGQIRVEMQRFTGACDSADAEENFAAMLPWIYSAGSVAPPAELDPLDACTPETSFYTGCRIRVYYEGLTQPARDGANIRVFLPENFRGNINATTEDNLWPEGTYFKRSNVVMKDVFGSASLQLESGTVQVTLADDILPAPFCAPEPDLNQEANDLCENFVDPNTMDPAPWDKDCGCVDKLGKVDVNTIDPESADITVDAPADFWTTINAANQQTGQTVDDSCTATVQCDDFTQCEPDASRCIDSEPWACAATTNTPAGALDGTGYSLKLTSTNCSEVNFHESPNDFGAEPQTEQRGDIVVCSGCLDIPTP